MAAGGSNPDILSDADSLSIIMNESRFVLDDRMIIKVQTIYRSFSTRQGWHCDIFSGISSGVCIHFLLCPLEKYPATSHVPDAEESIDCQSSNQARGAVDRLSRSLGRSGNILPSPAALWPPLPSFQFKALTESATVEGFEPPDPRIATPSLLTQGQVFCRLELYRRGLRSDRSVLSPSEP